MTTPTVHRLRRKSSGRDRRLEGIGLATHRAPAAGLPSVVITASDRAHLEAAESHYPLVEGPPVQADVREQKHADAAVAAAAERFGGLDTSSTLPESGCQPVDAWIPRGAASHRDE